MAKTRTTTKPPAAPKARPITTLAPWFGSNRTLAENVGAALRGCEWVGVPFAGGMSELAHIEARTLVANDLHRLVVNLALTAADPVHGPALWRRLRRLPFHPDVLAAAQARSRARMTLNRPLREVMPDPDAAADYFVCAWMGRSGNAGTKGELEGSLPIRWNANGGDSAVRYRSAVGSLAGWRKVLARVNFDCADAFDFLGKCKDAPGHGVYCDPPFPDAGEEYRHPFGHADHRRLAAVLGAYARCRVVCRFYDHPLVRACYPESAWQWNHFRGRTQANKAAPEVLLVNWASNPAQGA